MNRAGRRVELRRGARSVAACVRVRAYLALLRLHILHALTRALGEVLVGAHRPSGNGVDPVVPNGQVSGKSSAKSSAMAMPVHQKQSDGHRQVLGLTFATALPTGWCLAAPSATRFGRETSARRVAPSRRACCRRRARSLQAGSSGELRGKVKAGNRRDFFLCVLYPAWALPRCCPIERRYAGDGWLTKTCLPAATSCR